MPSTKIHFAISKLRTGKPHKELHKWIDNKKGINHRKENHFYTTKLKNYVSENFGGSEAVSEWLFHIALDNLSTYYKNERNYNNSKKNFIKLGFLDCGFIHCKEESKKEEEIEEHFKK